METKACNACNVAKVITVSEDRNRTKKDGIIKIYHKVDCKDCNEEKYREITNANRREKITCTCGCVLTKDSLRRHKKSQQHINATENENQTRTGPQVGTTD